MRQTSGNHRDDMTPQGSGALNLPIYRYRWSKPVDIQAILLRMQGMHPVDA